MLSRQARDALSTHDFPGNVRELENILERAMTMADGNRIEADDLLLETGRDPSGLRVFMAMEKWLADRPDLPGRLARQWLIDCYQNNDLIAGRLHWKAADCGIAAAQ